jgi:hypothetical protein
MLVEPVHPKDDVVLAKVGDIAEYSADVIAMSNQDVCGVGEFGNLFTISQRQTDWPSHRVSNVSVLVNPSGVDEASAGTGVHQGSVFSPGARR